MSRWIALVLFAATFLVYVSVANFDFVNFDDPDYVTNNVHVRAGLTEDSIAWAFTSGDAANWFPVTRLSHIIDYQLFGARSGLHHLTSVLFHALATLLLYAFLLRTTQCRWPSAFVAFLFALHPLHVESVAWVAERKDVLCAFFWFLTLWAYARYVQRPGLARYSLVLAAFGLGLMSKPMIVTLPFVLLLLDVWPLGRARFLLREKIPLFALAGAAAVVTFVVQKESGAVQAAATFPIGLRIENALISYVAYIAKMFWPGGLAVFYPYPTSVPVWQALLAIVFLLGVSAVVVRYFRECPYLAVGWCWYLGTLVPVIGLVQVGAQARADRYTYVPMIGLSIMLAWGALDALERWPKAEMPMAGSAVAACLLLTVVCEAQVQHWKNSETLFRHAIEATDGNYLAHHNLGVALSTMPGKLPEAISEYRAALAINPHSNRALTDLGNALSQMPDRLPEAVAAYQEALRIDPDAAITHNDLGSTLSKIPGRMPDAITEYEFALRIKPDYAEARNNLQLALAGNAESEYNTGVDFAKSGRAAEAIAHFEAALRIKPDYVDAHNNLGVVLAGSGRVPDAIAHFEAALKIDPNSADAHTNLGIALSGMPGRVPEAITHLEAALRIKPDPEVRQMLEKLRREK